MSDSISFKVAAIGVIAVVCFVASILVFGILSERKERFETVKNEVGNAWSKPQTIIGPMLVFQKPTGNPVVPIETLYVLPRMLSIESIVTPQWRSRGIFKTVVYTQTLRVNGTFDPADAHAAGIVTSATMPTFAVSLTDTRSIEKQITLNWAGTSIAFNPGSNTSLVESGVHTSVPLLLTHDAYTFSFELPLNGSEKIMFAPVGKETHVSVSSSWKTPEFTGAFLPTERTITPQGFTASWNVSSFGRSYPQYWNGTTVAFQTLIDSAFGVTLNQGVDQYQQVERSIKYAVLFIIITFATFFLFEVLTRIRVHPIQYLLIGAAIALFYLLLLSLSEHVGFALAYLISTIMIALLITIYSTKVLAKRSRAFIIFVVLLILYGYLYFILKLEDYALIFGAFLLFVLLAMAMYLTRNVDWFTISKGDSSRS